MKLCKSAEAVLAYLYNKRIFNRHKPEDKVLRFKARWNDKAEQNEFEKDYKMLVNEGIILRERKRTGKGSDWHIRINPKKAAEVQELVYSALEVQK